VTAYMARDTHRVLFKDGQPVALTGFNASLPDVVQIGAVYVPPELRCNGYARAAVALQLLEARRKGVSRSILFAANEPAERAYRALGYRQIGDYSLVMFSAPQKIPAQ
ncbi:MAG: GNAT family N-acetyltransferase, partial [Mangrovicoccus sp.]